MLSSLKLILDGQANNIVNVDKHIVVKCSRPNIMGAIKFRLYRSAHNLNKWGMVTGQDYVTIVYILGLVTEIWIG